MTIEELIELHGRERIEQAVEDLQPGGRLEGWEGRDLLIEHPIEYAVLDAVGMGNREMILTRYAESRSPSPDPEVPYRIRENYTLPEAAKTTKTPEELIAALNEAIARRQEMEDRASCIAEQEAEARTREVAAWQAVIGWATGQQTDK
jgi:hypothetical protein